MAKGVNCEEKSEFHAQRPINYMLAIQKDVLEAWKEVLKMPNMFFQVALSP